jgi:hypothetical protein
MGFFEKNFLLFLKECEFRFNYGSPKQLLNILKIICPNLRQPLSLRFIETFTADSFGLKGIGMLKKQNMSCFPSKSHKNEAKT